MYLLIQETSSTFLSKFKDIKSNPSFDPFRMAGSVSVITECPLATEVQRFVNKSFGVFKMCGSKQSVWHHMHGSDC